MWDFHLCTFLQADDGRHVCSPSNSYLMVPNIVLPLRLLMDSRSQFSDEETERG